MAEAFTLGDFDYAHRGLWTQAGPPENSLAAFAAAAAKGYGVELDVRPSLDGVPVVFHDRTLDRMTGQTGPVADRHHRDLKQMRLRGSDETLPTLEMLLERWPGQTPILCEIKIDGDTDPAGFARTVGGMLSARDLPVAAMSFSPGAVAALPAGLMRGQLFEASDSDPPADRTRLLDRVAAGGADYLAVALSDSAWMSDWARAHGLPLTVWTVRDSGLIPGLMQQVDAVIFEGFEPALAKRR